MPPGAGVPTPGASGGSNASRSNDTPYPAVPSVAMACASASTSVNAAAATSSILDDANAVPLRKHNLLGLEAAHANETDVMRFERGAGRRRSRSIAASRSRARAASGMPLMAPLWVVSGTCMSMWASIQTSPSGPELRIASADAAPGADRQE